jgi:TonB-linked SusC/RagA family outer membrane protein
MKIKLFKQFSRATILVLLLLGINLCTYSKTLERDIKVTLNYKNASLEKIILDLDAKTNFNYVFNKADIIKYQNISITVKDEPLTKVLTKVLKNTNLGYEFNYDVIVIKKQDKAKVIKGKVTDEKGETLIGVTVTVKGTKVGTATNMNGEFEIKGNINDILVISFIGMETKEVKYLGKALKITLKKESKELNEVVITGYQRIEKRKLCSSVSSVKGKDILESDNISIDKMLQGKIAGVSVMNQSSTPGAAPKIRIRGSSSISGNREPVWVVDGIILQDPVPLSPEELNSMDKVNLIGNAISFINPEDIERIDVLKDASATAIYGVRAANGVIVVTTKKGKIGKPRVSYTFSSSFVNRPDYSMMHRMNSAERIEVSEEMHRRGLPFHSFQPSRVAYEGALMDYWDKKTTYSEFRTKVQKLKNTNTDWYDLLFRNSFSQNHNVSVSGANENTNYYFSAGYSNQQGSTMDVNYKKYNAMMKLSTQITEKLKFGVNLNISTTENNRPHPSIDLYEYAYNTSRAIPAYNADGSRSFYAAEKSFESISAGTKPDPIGYNIFNELEHSGNKTKNKMTSATVNLDYNIKSNLRYNCTFNLNNTTSNTEKWFDEQSFTAQTKRMLPYGTKAPDDKSFYKKCSLPTGGEIDFNQVTTLSYVFRNSLYFSKTIKDHFFSTNLGFELRSSKIDGTYSRGYGYLPERGKKYAEVNTDLYTNFANIIKSNNPRITDTKNNYVSYYGTFTYSYKNRYIFNTNVRADGSNKFGQDKSTRFLPIWSISGRWNMAREKWFDNQNFLNQFSIRASYGIQGNVSDDQIPNLILTMGSKDEFANQYYSTLDKVPNTKLKWEKTTSYNLGIDFAFLTNRISGSLELYKKKGEDQVIRKEIPSTNGANNVSINRGTIENHGWELSLSSSIIDNKNWKLGLSFNTSKNYNKITDAGDPTNITYINYIDGSIICDGKAVNSFYSYRFNKLDENGLPTFKNYEEKDSEGNYIFTSLNDAYNKVFVYSGKREPDLSGGFSTYLKYKNFSINTIFAFSFGKKTRLNDLYKSSGQALPFPQQNMSDEFVNRWRKAGDEEFTNIPVLSADRLLKSGVRKYVVAENKWEMYNKSDIRIVSADFLRCRNLSLGYTFNLNKTKRLGVKNLSASLNVSNLFVIKSKELKGRDPEQINLGSGTIPPQRTYSLRLTATF